MDNPWATESSSPPPRPAPPSGSADDAWDTPWDTPPAPDTSGPTPSRAAPPEWLLRHCQQVSDEIWPPSEHPTSEPDWRSGFNHLADISMLLAQLAPADSTLPPPVQFSATATAKAVNEALKLTRNLPVSTSSPLSRLLASKGSLEWQKSIKAAQDVVPDAARVGWRVIEKEDRPSTIDESKQKKATGGFLSFWNRRASAIQAAPSEATGERSSSPTRPSLECVKSAPNLPSSQATSPPKPSTPSAPPMDMVAAVAPTPSAVSRFLNRFSRAKGVQQGALALSSDDLEFLSDIVPSASDPPDEDINNDSLDALPNASSLPSLPSKLPPLIPPPPKQSIVSNSALTLGTSNGANVVGNVEGTNHAPNIPVLAPPLSPTPVPALFSYTQSLSSLKDAAIASGQSNVSLAHQKLQLGSQPSSQRQPFLTLSPPQRVPPLSVPPLLPPPPVSSPQTPRPSTISATNPGVIRQSDSSHFDSNESDDEFTAFTSFPPPAPALFPSSDLYPQRTPTPPSPPPRRTYERTHYPSSSSASSMFSPASQSSADKLYSTKSVTSSSLDSFDDFVSPPSPPPLPAKPQSQRRQPSRIDTYLHHSHTPSQTFTSPTVHTSLMTNMFSVSAVSDAERQRTQALVNHAAALGGLPWPSSPKSDEEEGKAIPAPLSRSTSPRTSVTEGEFDLLGDGDGSEALSTSPNAVRDSLRPQPGVVSSPGRGLGLRDQLQPTPPPLLSTSTPALSSSSWGSLPTSTNAGRLQPAKARQLSGLSAQDLSFFEGL